MPSTLMKVEFILVLATLESIRTNCNLQCLGAGFLLVSAG